MIACFKCIFFMIGILSVMFSLFISLIILNVFLFFLYIISLFLFLGNSMASQKHHGLLGCHTYASVDIGHFFIWALMIIMMVAMLEDHLILKFMCVAIAKYTKTLQYLLVDALGRGRSKERKIVPLVIGNNHLIFFITLSHLCYTYFLIPT